MVLTRKLFEFGLLIGLISIAISVIYYFLGVPFMFKWWNALIGLGIGIFMIIFFGRRYRSSIGGYIDYWNAYLALLIMFSVSAVMTTSFNTLLYGVIDTELPAKMQDAKLQSTVEWMQFFGAPQDKIDEQLDKMQQEPNEFLPLNQVKRFPYSILGLGILFLLMALFIRKPRPILDDKPLDQPPA